MTTVSPPKPWQSSNGSSSSTINDTSQSGLSLTSSSSTGSSRIKPWEREASSGRIDDDYQNALKNRRSSDYDTTYSSSRYGSSYGSNYGSGYGSNYGSGYGSNYGSGYGSNYGSGYGSNYGGYGYDSYGGMSRYGGYGGYGDYGYGGGYGHGGYGGGYGGYGGYGRDWSKYGPPNGPNGLLDWRGAADQGFQWVNGFHSVTAGFGRFAGLLDANSQAMHGLLSSIVRLIENAGLLYREIGLAISGFTIFKLIQRAVRKFMGLSNRSNQGNSMSDAVDEFNKENSSNSSAKFWFVLITSLVAAAFFGLPLLDKMLKKYAGAEDPALQDAWDEENNNIGRGDAIMQVRAIHDYDAQDEKELTLRQGDVVDVLRKPFEIWWEGSIVGRPNRIGLFPINHTKPIENPDNAQSNSHSHNGKNRSRS